MAIFAAPSSPDIVMRTGYQPTQREYDTALRLLREIAGGDDDAFKSTRLQDDEYEPWCALFRCGLVVNVDRQPWNVLRVTKRGELYLKTRPPK